MALKIVSFEEALKISDNYGKKHLLLGNGFSIACKPDIFSYSSLFKEAKKKMSRKLAKTFAALKTQDFEKVIRALMDASSILGVYLPKKLKSKARLSADSEQLKKDLIQAVAGTHPARPYDVSDEQFQACRMFLANFVGMELAGGYTPSTMTCCYTGRSCTKGMSWTSIMSF